jgi:hypothetical protein
MSVKVAVCDADAFCPLRDLVVGPFNKVSDLAAIERFIRTVVLHDKMVMEPTPWPYDPEVDFEPTEEEKRAGRTVITAIGPTLTGFSFFAEHNWRPPLPEIQLTAPLLDVAAQFANAGPGNAFFKAHIEYLKLALGIVAQGGSALMCSEFGQKAVKAASKYPEEMFRSLDEEWQRYASSAEQDRFGLLVPPVLGIVLTRCTHRAEIPTAIKDLRDEWADARKKVWNRLDALRVCRTLDDANDIHRELSEASSLFPPNKSAAPSHPIRIFWGFMTAMAAGAGLAELSGKGAVIGALGGAITQAARVAPTFGPAVFGRGAFDLANKVRRGARQVEFAALSRLLTSAEKGKLGLP